MPTDLVRNKRNAMNFYDMAFNQNKPEEAIEKFAGAGYKQHNPKVPDGKQGFIDYFNKLAKEYPGKHVVFKRIIAEGDFVVFHCYQTWPGDKDWASIDIFRCDENGKVIEHWDVLQEIPDTSANENTMF
ncbi:MAG: hypothetical protein EHM58_09430 [Ignavibacteriae bacterium]|nr:MAG: hypothetical protein EHM58_09430 [Ignavibacteriota bacterium]